MLGGGDAVARKKKPSEPEPIKTAGGMPSPLQDPMEAEHSAPTATPAPTGDGKAATGTPANGGTSPTSGGSASTGGNSGGGGNTAAGGSTNEGMGAGGQNGQFNKPGRFMVNLKVGPAICATGCPSHEGAAGLEIGWSVLPNKNAYVVVPLQFQFSSSTSAVLVPLGFQYDFAISRVPGLYIYPRISLGYAALFNSSTGVTQTQHGGVFIPEAGIKFILRGRFNFGGEFFSLPVLFGPGDFGRSFTYVYYRILVHAGINF